MLRRATANWGYRIRVSRVWPLFMRCPGKLRTQAEQSSRAQNNTELPKTANQNKDGTAVVLERTGGSKKAPAARGKHRRLEESKEADFAKKSTSRPNDSKGPDAD